MIKILETKDIFDELGQTIIGRHVEVIISNGVEVYLWRVGGLPIDGDLQIILDNRFDELWEIAQAKGRSLARAEIKRLLRKAAWTNDEFQEALVKRLLGDVASFDLIIAKYQAIESEML